MAKKSEKSIVERNEELLSILKRSNQTNMLVFEEGGNVIFHHLSSFDPISKKAHASKLIGFVGEAVLTILLEECIKLTVQAPDVVLDNVEIGGSLYCLHLALLPASSRKKSSYSLSICTSGQVKSLISKGKQKDDNLSLNSEIFIQEFAIPYVLLELIYDDNNQPVDYCYLSVNSSFEELSELEADKIVGKTCKEVYGHVDLNWVSFLQDVAENNEATKLFDYDKNINKYLEISVLSPRKNVVACAYFDITEFITSNKSLKKEQDYVKSLLDANPDLMFVLDAAGKFVDWHGSHAHGIDTKPDQIIGQDVKDVLPPNVAQLTKDKLQEVLSSKKLVEYQYTLENNDETHYFDARMVLYGEDKAVCIIRDISNNVNAENELEKHRRTIEKKNTFLKEVMNGVANPFWVIDVRGDDDFFYMDSNEAHGALTGISLKSDKELSVNTLLGRFGSEYVKSVISRYKECVKTKKRVQYEEVVEHEGAEMWNLTTLSPQLNKKGEVYRIVCSSTDISHLKKTEEEIIHAKEKAMEADRLKTVFLANLSHEIRTPLNSIIGFSELIQEGDLDDSEREDMCRIIERNSSQLLKLINDIIEISKIESEQLKVVYRDFDLNRLMDDLSHEMEIEMYRKKKVLPVKVEKELFDRVIFSSDEYRIKQIFQSLLNNALKFCEKGSIEFGYTREDNNEGVLFFVRDTGIGIEKEKQDVIFELFRQLDDNSTRRYAGTGLGLSLCKRITNILGGKMWVESELGVGTTFFFSIPKRS